MMATMREGVNQAGHIARAEAVIDVNDGNARSAGIQHRQQGRKAAKVSAITDRCRYGDHGRCDKAGDYAGQGALHTGGDYKDIGLEQARQLIEKAMNSCDTDIACQRGGMAHHPRRKRGFFRHGQVRCARANYGDSRKERPRLAVDCRYARKLVILGVGNGVLERPEAVLVEPGDEQAPRLLDEPRPDSRDLLRRFPLAEDYLRQGVTQGPVMVDLGEPKVLVG